ncbi:uncharacterized protein At1g08160 [Malania oleifera]|uniref:uncharacterized protein At1g08160 n=1 Tax=Malania oleifera TaxID=397392 RepID=UPI0025AEA488|nr:uncharacterized protein At1g08160 [Malania oleifera]
MANPPTIQSRPRHPLLLRVIAMVILSLIVLVGIAVLITWLVIKPKRLVYTVEDASIHGFNLTNDHLNADLVILLRSYNPNSRVSIYYDSMEVSVAYDDQAVAFQAVEPFFQGHRNVTRLELMLPVRSALLSKSAAKDLALEKSAKEIELDVHVKARIRYKVGGWKSRDRALRMECSPVLVHPSSSKNFERTYCDLDL